MDSWTAAWSSPFFMLFAVMAVGVGLGAVRMEGVSRGAAAVFFVVLVAGHFQWSLPTEMADLGLVLFVYAVGLRADSRNRRHQRASTDFDGCDHRRGEPGIGVGDYDVHFHISFGSAAGAQSNLAGSAQTLHDGPEEINQEPQVCGIGSHGLTKLTRWDANSLAAHSPV